MDEVKQASINPVVRHISSAEYQVFPNDINVTFASTFPGSK
jgi:hypothetical protein